MILDLKIDCLHIGTGLGYNDIISMGYSSDIESNYKCEEKPDNDENGSISNNNEDNGIENDINVFFGFEKGDKFIENGLVI
ncbi:hypothetical protein AYI70_g7817 [Smittium culicis]|uniref:Uncharacterized protein n=1 Tax=Smittium culicis TaxID=133412 RepID=A0A1R1XIR0_9FUNG|nr:hypothetical protein AYI70_g7817 [Smittium culicis]